MKAIILAAGIGSRIRPLTDNKHKSLLPVGKKTILERMVENILSVGIEDIIVVTGYLEDQIVSFLNKTFPGVPIKYIRNDKYLETNTGYSLMLTKELVKDDDFIKFDADVVFDRTILDALVSSIFSSSLCIDRNIDLAAEEVKVKVDDKNRVIQVGKKIAPHEATGESIGIEKISKEAAMVLFSELESLMKNKKNLQEYYDDTYTTLVEKGVPFHALDVTGLKWVEIDTHEDYEHARRLFAE